MASIKEEYGSVVKFIVEKRLQWTDCEARDADPFNTPGTSETRCVLGTMILLLIPPWADDIKILYNDWPYGIDTKIIHLVVWTKFDLDEDPVTGDLTARKRQELDDYVERTFRTRVPRERVRLIHVEPMFWVSRMLTEFQGRLV